MSGGALSRADVASHTWHIKGKELDLSRKSLVMGVLNVTPDSFSDGGEWISPEKALEHAAAMISAGADILDIGAESTRPGRPQTVTPEEEWKRFESIVVPIRKQYPDILISIDTYRGETALQCLEAGADIINDIYALRHNAEIADHVAAHDAGLILMHMQGTPETMQVGPVYDDVVVDVREFLSERLHFAMERGVPQGNIAVDPGFGFGKTLQHNVELLAGLEYLRLLQRPICVGLSRKGFLGKLTGQDDPLQRDVSTACAQTTALLHGATIVRTHQVRYGRESAALIDAMRDYM